MIVLLVDIAGSVNDCWETETPNNW